MHRLPSCLRLRPPGRVRPALAAALTVALIVLALLIAGGSPLWAQSAPAPAPREDQELIAVLDLKAAGASDVEALALTERLREVLLKTDRFILVDRSQMDALLNEQALQQTGCTEQDCAVQVGRILGVRKIVAGRAIKVSDDVWLLSALLVDVETARTLRAESLRHRGDFFDLLDRAVVALGTRLAGAAQPAEAPTAQPAAASSAPAAPVPAPQPAQPQPLFPPSAQNKKRIALFPARLQGEQVGRLTADEKKFGAALLRVLDENVPWIEVTLSAYDGDTPSKPYAAYRASPFGDRWGDDAWSGLFTVEPNEAHVRGLFPRGEAQLALLIRSSRERGRNTGYGVYLLDLERGRRFESAGSFVPGQWGKTVREALREVLRDYQDSWR